MRNEERISSFGAHVEGRGGDVASLVCVPAIDSEWPFLCGLCSASHSITRCAVERQYRHLIGRLL
ncbi:uncharacterized protein [Physcomitrium patens]|uniref:uncharacterized protein isoform X7 n=1 Tax=Physcomitrium patens TaxID=3218 RepID=UPI003CCDEBC5